VRHHAVPKGRSGRRFAVEGGAWSGADPRLPQGGPPGRGLGRSDGRAMGCPERASGARVRRRMCRRMARQNRRNRQPLSPVLAGRLSGLGGAIT